MSEENSFELTGFYSSFHSFQAKMINYGCIEQRKKVSVPQERKAADNGT